MNSETVNGLSTLALNTTLEQEFISPLSALRSALEIVRDHPELDAVDRGRFLDNALAACVRLERGVSHLASATYGAEQGDHHTSSSPVAEVTAAGAAVANSETQKITEFNRLAFEESAGIAILDLRNLVFRESADVDDFFDQVDRQFESSGRSWQLIQLITSLAVWPKAWIAYAHRQKNVAKNHAHALVRVDEKAIEVANVGDEIYNNELEARARLATLA